MRDKASPYTSCDLCCNYQYDEEDECYYCLVDMDQDDYYRFLAGSRFSCPYFRNNDEYEVVRHQA